MAEQLVRDDVAMLHEQVETATAELDAGQLVIVGLKTDQAVNELVVLGQRTDELAAGQGEVVVVREDVLAAVLENGEGQEMRVYGRAVGAALVVARALL